MEVPAFAGLGVDRAASPTPCVVVRSLGLHDVRSTGQRRAGQTCIRRVNRMTRYFAHISHKGKIRHGDVPGSIGVLEAPDQFMPIGIASCRTWDGKGLAVWTLRIGDQEIPGRWVIVDREFRPVEAGIPSKGG